MEPAKANVAPVTESKPPAEVPKLRLTKPHLLIQRTMDQKPEKDSYGYVREPDWPGVDVRVNKTSKRDALIVLDRFFKALEKVEITVEVIQHVNYNYGGPPRGTYAVRGNDRIPIYIKEEYKKVEHVPTAKELRDKEQFRSRIPKWDDVPTGKLTLEPGGVVDLSSEEALAILIAKSVADVVLRLDIEQRRRVSAEEARHQEYLRQKAEQDEKGRVEALYKASDALHRYHQLMEYIEEVRRFGQIPDDQRKEGQSMEEWLRWAEWRARQIHPLG